MLNLYTIPMVVVLLGTLLLYYISTTRDDWVFEPRNSLLLILSSLTASAFVPVLNIAMGMLMMFGYLVTLVYITLKKLTG